MIIKGKSRGNGAQLGRYLVRHGENEIIRVVEIRGLSATDVPSAVLEMDALAAGARTEKGLYHAHINTPADERMTDQQRAYAVDRLESALGLTGQPRVVVVHEKKGREHCHIVWSRIDLDRMAAIPDSHNYRKHEQVARDLERAFGFRRVQGAHAERDGRARPSRTPDQAEMQQAERTGLSALQVKAEITGLWRTTDSGRAFAEALAQAGYILARGDRRDFVVIDPNGGTHSLSRRIEGARAKDIRTRMADIDGSRLPSVAEAKEIQLSRQGRAREIPRESSGGGAAEGGLIPGMDGPSNGTAGRNSNVQGAFSSVAASLFRPSKRTANKRPGANNVPASRRQTSTSGGFGSALSPKSSAAGRYLLPLTPHAGGIRWRTRDEAHLRGEFRAQALWISAPASRDTGGGDIMARDGEAEEDIESAEFLDGIVAEVQGKAAGARAAIMAEYSGKIAHARRALPRREAAGAVRALMQARSAALAHIGREASREIALRRDAAVRARRKERGRPRSVIRRDEPPQGPRPN